MLGEICPALTTHFLCDSFYSGPYFLFDQVSCCFTTHSWIMQFSIFHSSDLELFF